MPIDAAAEGYRDLTPRKVVGSRAMGQNSRRERGRAPCREPSANHSRVGNVQTNRPLLNGFGKKRSERHKIINRATRISVVTHSPAAEGLSCRMQAVTMSAATPCRAAQVHTAASGRKTAALVAARAPIRALRANGYAPPKYPSLGWVRRKKNRFDGGALPSAVPVPSVRRPERPFADLHVLPHPSVDAVRATPS